MSFCNETPVKAVRKRHSCNGCPTAIEIGEPALRVAGVWEGDFWTGVYHHACRAAECAYNRHIGVFWEWYPLCEIEHDDHDWLLAEFPIVAARFGITAETIKAHADERERVRRAFVVRP